MKNGTILITGGGGYIGSHIGLACFRAGYRVIALDILRYKQPFSLPFSYCIQGNCGNHTLLDTIFSTEPVMAVIHCAARIEVGLSATEPLDFYHTNNNVFIILLERMVKHGVPWLLFSSSAAVYGNPSLIPIAETSSLNPLNVYGRTKLIGEQLLADVSNAHPLQFVSLRYFNVAGAQPEDGLREYHKPETHLIPLLLHMARRQAPFEIYGTDYPTPDGTCLRDFIHVRDVADAHVAALSYLQEGHPNATMNIASGRGTSVRDIIDRLQTLCRVSVRTVSAPRREGDAPALIADITRARTELSWEPVHSSLDEIILSARAAHHGL